MSSHHLLNDNSSSSQSSEWTREENKAFESARALYGEHDPHHWLKVDTIIPGKSVSDVIEQYRELEEDVCEIEAGRVPIPGYLAADDDAAFSLDLIVGLDFVDSYRKGPMCSTKTSDQGRHRSARRCILVGQVRRFNDEGRRRGERMVNSVDGDEAIWIR
ncbi:unnamed protein product [Linum tenue]|uniref:Myb-like domain-containing protein n=1 Tax=Linum tenue TaxID=586396 RepID=A0AAV0L8P0_9ROSI|nr:unnamed protein product [Linum tenue]